MGSSNPLDPGSGLKTLQSAGSPLHRSVLIVEDDELVQLRLESLLEPAGYSVTCVASAREARLAVAAICFQIVILDRMLPDGDGITLCEELRTSLKQSRVFLLVLSARDSALDVGAGLRAGADVYLNKRTTDAELVAYLDAATAVAQFAASR